MVGEGSYDFWIAKIHTYFHAGINGGFLAPVGNVNCVAEEGFIHRYAIPLYKLKVSLMNVKCMKLFGTIFDDPVFYVSLLDGDVRHSRVMVELLRSLSFHRHEKLGRTAGIIGILLLFRKIEPACTYGLQVTKRDVIF